MNLTFTSSFIHIYKTPYDHRNNEWRIERFEEIASTGIKICLYISNEFIAIMNDLCIKYPNIRIMRVLSIQETRIWKVWHQGVRSLCDQPLAQSALLPENRKAEKDTIEYLCLMNSKIEFMGDTIRENPFQSEYFAWIDFNISHVFKRTESTSDFIRFLGKCNYTGNFLTIPGCWEKDIEPSTDQICWRFCGGFFMGHRENIIEFAECVWENVVNISPTWEVNVWAMVERKGIYIDWFLADHNDSMIRNFPAKYYSIPLERVIGTKMEWRNVEYPILKHFQPSSISHCHYEGIDYINVRFVNYHLTPNGYYHYPDGRGKIDNINMVSQLDRSMVPKNGFTKMREKNLGLTEKDAFSRGLEDIRIYVSSSNVRFIATTVGYSKNGGNQMVVGDYDVLGGEFRNGEIIESPFGAVCEKNWIPLPTIDDHYIYSWHPYRVGKAIGGKLEIVDEVFLSPPIFEKVRGSTIFLKREDGNYLGIVHFSENESPRHYFHLFVILDAITYRPVSYSQPFTFYGEGGIEFCIGFCIYGDKYRFWVSRFDREPKMFVVSKETIENLFIL
jgi:hypothetical protein